MKLHIALLFFLHLLIVDSKSQTIPGWTNTAPFEHKVFIENKGQFTEQEKTAIQQPILYYSRIGKMQMYFTATSVTFRYDSIEPIEENSNENEKDVHAIKVIPEYLKMAFGNPNSNAIVEMRDPANDYFTYDDPIYKSGHQSITANAFKKLIYKNIYEGIDIEFYFPDDKPGIEYTIIVHPGADPSAVKMIYSGNAHILSKDHNLLISSPGISLIDHQPIANNTLIQFSISDNTVSFKTDSYDKTQTLVIDPWITSTAFAGFNSAYDISYDNYGNVYIGGGEPPYQFQKYNNTGALIWTYQIPFGNGPSLWWGAFTTDIRNGTSYITEGLSGNNLIVKVSSSGIEEAILPTSIPAREFWRVSFDYCNNQLILGAGLLHQAAIVDTNLINFVDIDFFGGSEHDMALLTLDNHGAAYMASNVPFLGTPSFNNRLLKLPLPSLLPAAFNVSDGYNFIELENITYYPFQPNGSGANYANGFNGIAANKAMLVTYDGAVLKKWKPSKGTLLKSVSVSSTSFQWGGTDLDCQNNIYVGNNNSISVYDSNLNYINSIPLAGTVYALKLAGNSKLYACGNGFVQAVNINVADSVTISTVAPTTCVSSDGSAAVNVSCSGNSHSYLWSNGQTTQTANGLKQGMYTVIIKDDTTSCVPSETIQTINLKGGNTGVFVPEAFSPNGDGQNDKLYVRDACIKTLDFVIFDRWGNKVFETTDIDIGWDGTYKGKALNTDTFVYYLTATMEDGKTTINKKGNVTLVR